MAFYDWVARRGRKEEVGKGVVGGSVKNSETEYCCTGKRFGHDGLW